MPAQKTAVLPLPLDPVTATEIRCSLARSTASASSSAASRARQGPLPYFGRSNTNRSGPEHAPEFTISVLVGDTEGSGIAGSKRAAEQRAAEALLARLEA